MTTAAMLALLSMLTTSCIGGTSKKDAQAEETEEEPLPQRYESDDLPPAADELFDDFVYYFASNEQLQRRRTAFPIAMKEGKNVTMIEQEQWVMDSLFMSKGEYVLIFDKPEEREQMNDTTVNKVVVEKLFLSADSMTQYQFERMEGRWNLCEIRKRPMNGHPNAAFLKFYQQFASDSAFQANSLADEIAFSGADPDDDFAQMDGFITPDSWEAFAPELPQDSIFHIDYGSHDARSKTKLFVICGISNGLEMELTFQQKRGKWRLTRLTE